VIAIVLHSKLVVPARVSARQVFSHGLAVFALFDDADFAILSSAMHQIWAITYGSTLGSAPRYTPSAGFETFPRPNASERLAAAGKALHERRMEIGARRHLGLNGLYNLVNDPLLRGDRDIEEIRSLHVEIDAATMQAYGWGDLPLEHGYHEFRQITRFTISPLARAEILDRLLEENHRRAAAEGQHVHRQEGLF
jgi:hypothetical protein